MELRRFAVLFAFGLTLGLAFAQDPPPAPLPTVTTAKADTPADFTLADVAAGKVAPLEIAGEVALKPFHQFVFTTETAPTLANYLSKGEIVSIDGIAYYVTYQPIPKQAGYGLKLVRVSSVRSVQVLPAEQPAEVSNDQFDRLTSALKHLSLVSNGAIPYVQSTPQMRALLLPLVGADALRAKTEGSVLYFNVRLAGVTLANIKDPASAVVWYEKPSDANAPFQVGFLDGQVKKFTAAEKPQLEHMLGMIYSRPANLKPLSIPIEDLLPKDLR